MLSQDEQRRLRGSEWTMSLLDPRFADGLRDGTPCAPNDDRRWPFLAWAVGAVVVMFVGLGTTAWFFCRDRRRGRRPRRGGVPAPCVQGPWPGAVRPVALGGQRQRSTMAALGRPFNGAGGAR